MAMNLVEKTERESPKRDVAVSTSVCFLDSDVVAENNSYTVLPVDHSTHCAIASSKAFLLM